MEARQVPTFEVIPPHDFSVGQDACDLASAYFGDPMEWQRHVISVMLAYRRGRNGRKDKFATHSVALSVPRQNGKSWVIRAWCFYAMCVLGYKVLYTCQNGDTADEMFQSLAAVFEDEENEDVHPLLVRVRRTNGQQGIYLTNGGCIRFTTRTDSLARGRSYDALIYDECQELTPSQQAASLPTISASKRRNTMVIYLGTPPIPTKDGGVFRDMHDAAHSANPGKGAWMEWAATEVGDKSDVSRWYETNPSLGPLIDESAIEGETSMCADDFARERLGWWSPTATAARSAIPRRLWDDAAIGEIGDAYRGKVAFAVKFSPDGTTYALAGCKLGGSGRAAVELVEIGGTERGTRPLAQALADRASTASVVVVDGMSGASALCDNLAEARVPRGYVCRPRTSDVIASAQGLLDALSDGSLAHSVQPALEDSAHGCARRCIGNRGGWGFGDADGHSSVPIEACALALWGARTTRRNPKRKQRLL